MFKFSFTGGNHANGANRANDLRFVSRIDAYSGGHHDSFFKGTLTTGRHKTLVEALQYLTNYVRTKNINLYCSIFYVKDVKTDQEIEFQLNADGSDYKFQLRESAVSNYSAEFKAAFLAAVAQANSASSSSSVLSTSSYAYQVFSNLLNFGAAAASPLSPAKPAAKISASSAAVAAASSPAPVPNLSAKPAASPKVPNYAALLSTIKSEEDAFRCCVNSINEGKGEQLIKTIEAYPGVIMLKSTEAHGSPLIISTLYQIRKMADALPSVNKDVSTFRSKIESLLQAAQFIVSHHAFIYRDTDADGNTPMHRVFWYAIHVQDQAISERLIQIGLEMLKKIRSSEFRKILNQKNRSNESCRNNIELIGTLQSRFTPAQQGNYSRLHEALKTLLLLEQP